VTLWCHVFVKAGTRQSAGLIPGDEGLRRSVPSKRYSLPTLEGVDDFVKESGKILAQIVAVIGFSTALALLVNGVRKDGLALVMPFPPEYRCPSQMTEGRSMPAKEALRQHGRKEAVFVDARSQESYAKGHIKGAINLAYSFLDAVPREAVDQLRKDRMIIVYCNTESAERSKLMAGELSEEGLKEVSYLGGGFLGWVRAGGPYTGQKPEGYE
jgi:rhodanese-related sulfurtransferase